MKKRIASLLVGGVLVASTAFGLTACQNGGGKEKLVLWGPAAQQLSLQQMVDQFLEENPDFGLEIELGIAGEGDVKGLMSNDPKSGADVYGYANDQVIDLLTMGALARLSSTVVDGLKEANTEKSVEAGKVGEGYYGYPYAADNGFFMYYDKSVVSEEETTNLKDVLEACRKKHKYFIYQLTTGWYVGSFAYGAGAKYEAVYGGDDGTELQKVECNFDQLSPDGTGEYTYGEIGGQQLIDLNSHTAFQAGNDDTITTYLSEGKLGACITGTWLAGTIEEYLKTNYGVATLPDWTSSLTGETYHWVSFAGYKLYGVNSYSKHLPEAHKLAAFLSSEKMQEKRFDDNKIGPSNVKVAAMDKVKSNLAIATIAKEIEETAITQKPMPGTYWTEMEAFGKAMEGWKKREDKSQTLAQRVKELVEALKEV